MENQEVAVINKKVNKALATVQEIVINDAKTVAEGIDLREGLQKFGKFLKQKKESVTKPMLLALKNHRAMFRPAEDSCKEATEIISNKLGAYKMKIDAENAEEERKITARVEKGTLKPETAVKKIEKLEVVSPKGKTAKITFKTHRSMEITDASKLPREYLVPNTVLIRKDILAGVKISGAKLVETQIPSSSR